MIEWSRKLIVSCDQVQMGNGAVAEGNHGHVVYDTNDAGSSLSIFTTEWILHWLTLCGCWKHTEC
jgi:hypothetical protein